MTADGQPKGVMYGADSLLGAVSETLFHTLPTGDERLRPCTIARARIEQCALSILAPTRTLRLIDLTGLGLGRTGMPITQGELILSNASHYARTRAWAEAFYSHPLHVDGFVWMSRQYNLARALLLFADRVGEDGLALAMPTALAGRSPVVEQIEDAAQQARIVIID